MAALDSLGKHPLSIGLIAPSPDVVNLWFNDSTSEGDGGKDLTGPWNKGEGIEIVEAPAFKDLSGIKA